MTPDLRSVQSAGNVQVRKGRSQKQKWSGSNERNGGIPERGVSQQIEGRDYCIRDVWFNIYMVLWCSMSIWYYCSAVYLYGTVVQYAIAEQGCASTLGAHANNCFAFMYVRFSSFPMSLLRRVFTPPPLPPV